MDAEVHPHHFITSHHITSQSSAQKLSRRAHKGHVLSNVHHGISEKEFLGMTLDQGD